MIAALSYEVHKLTAQLDRRADRLLRANEELSYSRFLALLAIQQGAVTQRDVARWLGQSEPSTSRTIGVLAGDRLLTVRQAAERGNRHHLELTARGEALVGRCRRLLEDEFAQLLRRSGVSYAAYQRNTKRLLRQLDSEQERSA